MQAKVIRQWQDWQKPRHLRTRSPRSGLTLRLMFSCHLEEARNDRLRIVAQRDAAPMSPFADTRREKKRIMVSDDYDEIARVSQVIAYVDLSIGRSDTHGEELHGHRGEHQRSMDSHKPSPHRWYPIDQFADRGTQEAGGPFAGPPASVYNATLSTSRGSTYRGRKQRLDEAGHLRSRLSRPPLQSLLSIASPFGRRLCLGHPFRHLRFDCVKIETRAPLHWRVIEEGLEFLGDQLLDKDKTPELVLEPIEVLLCTVFRPIAGPARALERIQAQIGDVRHVRMGLFAHPTSGLINEAKLVVVNSDRADGAFAEIEDFMTRGGALAGNGGHLIIAI